MVQLALNPGSMTLPDLQLYTDHMTSVHRCKYAVHIKITINSVRIALESHLASEIQPSAVVGPHEATIGRGAGVSVLVCIVFSMETAMPGATENQKIVSVGTARVFDARKKETHQWASIGTRTRNISGSA